MPGAVWFSRGHIRRKLFVKNTLHIRSVDYLCGAKKQDSGCSVARLARLLWEQEVAGSNPATPTKQGKALLH
jgi:hypothetical protein